jgi:hypothetical protein
MTAPTMSTTSDHVHDHGPTHEHGHPHGPEQTPGPSEPGSIVLDIGPGVGAAVVITPVDMNGLEIEYRSAGDQWNEKHMAVRERRGGGELRYAAIFGPLPQGIYEFRERGSERREPQLVVTVVEASVTSASWPDQGGDAGTGSKVSR